MYTDQINLSSTAVRVCPNPRNLAWVCVINLTVNRSTSLSVGLSVGLLVGLSTAVGSCWVGWLVTPFDQPR